ncbi:hypothetical protein PMm318_A31380 [Pseudomonas moorei]
MTIWLRILPYIAALLIGAVGAWIWQANSYGQIIATNEAGRQADMARISAVGAAQALQAVEKRQAAEQALATLDQKAQKEKTDGLAENEKLLLTLLAGCAPREVVVPVAGTCPTPPAPPAWAMQAPSNSLQLLDRLFSISALESSPTKQP